MLDLDDVKVQEIEDAIKALDEAIEFYRKINTKLNEQSHYHWTPKIGEISSIIGKFLQQRKELSNKLEAYKMVSRPLLNPNLNAELNPGLLAMSMINAHNDYVNWRF